MAEEDRMLLSGEVAKIFRVDPKTVARWAKQGRMTSYKTPGGRNRFLESEVRQHMAGMGVPVERLEAVLASGSA